MTQRQRLVEVLGYGRSRSPPPDPESPPGETAAAERPDSPSSQPIMGHLLEMGFTAPHIRKALEAMGMKQSRRKFIYVFYNMLPLIDFMCSDTRCFITNLIPRHEFFKQN